MQSAAGIHVHHGDHYVSKTVTLDDSGLLRLSYIWGGGKRAHNR